MIENRSNVSRLCADGLDPVLHSVRYELRVTIRPNERWHTKQDEQVAQRINDTARVQLAIHTDGKAFSTVLVNDVQRPERLSITGSTMYEVIAPNVIATFRRQPNTRSIVQPKLPFLWLFLRHFQPLSPL